MDELKRLSDAIERTVMEWARDVSQTADIDPELAAAVGKLLRFRSSAEMLTRAAKLPPLDIARWRDARDRPDYPIAGRLTAMVRSFATLITDRSPEAIPTILSLA